jgi:puromycin-sensitive aminopeptidase
MWFGDLVTMGWWDGIWLNEAFATFMEIKATDAMRPEWNRWISFGAVERPWAFAVDALASTRPVEFEVRSPDEANEMFDALTYGKGSSVLRMIEQFLGDDVFRAGVGQYLRTHAYANTVTRDLWEGLDQASGTDVGAIMDTWILQGGFPQIEVSVDGSRVTLTQRRYLSIPEESDATRWQVPLQIRGSIDGRSFNRKHLLVDETEVLEFDGSVEWIIGNAGGHGFYRTSYDAGTYDSLIGLIPDLDPLERFVLIDDAWAFVQSGQIGVDRYLDLAAAYRDETDFSVWSAIAAGLGSIDHHLTSGDHRPAFEALVDEIVRPAADRMGWETSDGESDLDRRLRGLLLGLLGRVANDAEVIERAAPIVQRWFDEPGKLDPEIAQSALFTWASHGDLDTLERLFVARKSAPNPQAELKMLQAMTSIDLAEAADRVLEAVNDGTIRSQDIAWVVARLMSGRRSGAHAWSEIRRSWDDLTSKLPPMTLRSLIGGIPALSEPGVAADVEAHFSEVELPTVAKTVAQNLEKLRTNTLLRERETGVLADYLAERTD